MIWFVLYILIGFVCGILMYAYHCYSFTKQTYYRTWFSYYNSVDVDEKVILSIMLWPLVIVITIISCIAFGITSKIKNYFGIE